MQRGVIGHRPSLGKRYGQRYGDLKEAIDNSMHVDAPQSSCIRA